MAATAAAKSGSGRSKNELMSISALSLRYELDRATVRKRIQAAGLQPVSAKTKEKLFELTPQLDQLLDATDAKMAEAKLRKESAAARLNELKVAEAEGGLAPVTELTEAVQKIFAAMHKEIAVRMPGRLAARLAKAKKASDTQKIVATETNRIFTLLRDNHEQFLGKRDK